MSIYDMIMITGMYTLSWHLYTVEDYQLKQVHLRPDTTEKSGLAFPV